MIESCVEFLEPIIDLITLVIITLLNKNEPNSDLTDDDDDVPGPGPGPGGDDSEPDDNDDKNKKLDKGKGKAKAITPELTPEETQESDKDEKQSETDLKIAKLNSLRDTTDWAYTDGESSKQGAHREIMLSLEEQKQRILEEKNQRILEEQNQKMLDEKYKVILDEYHESKKARLGVVRAFNDIMDYINENGDSMHPSEKESLLDQSIKLRNLVEHYSNHAQTLKDVLSIDSSEEEFSEDSNSEEYESENYSDEEPRPSKRPKN